MLSERQQRFVDAYLLDPNATAAARTAGYKHCHVAGARLLANVNVKAAIARSRKERNERVKVDADWVLYELSMLARANPLDYVKISADGKTTELDLSKLTRDQAAAIQELSFEPQADGTTKIKFKLVDKIKTIALLGKHTDVRAFEEHLRVTSGDSIADYIDRAQSREREREEKRTLQ
jgi:phage terminase small subunit